jgi:uncharacterized protein
MDPHVRICNELFSAVRSEFKQLKQYYFHNFPYETPWRDNRRGTDDHISTMEILHTYGRDYKLILVGDATMNLYEITDSNGSVEYRNLEPGEVWLKRLLQAFPHAAWFNPQPKARWQQTPSIELTRNLLGGRMYPLTLSGLDEAMSALT